MSNYLSNDELAAIIGCQSNSYACMRRWLTKNNWPFAENIRGFPIVSLAYHDARMSGADPRALAEKEPRVEPDFSHFDRPSVHQLRMLESKKRREQREQEASARRIPR